MEDSQRRHQVGNRDLRGCRDSKKFFCLNKFVQVQMILLGLTLNTLLSAAFLLVPGAICSDDGDVAIHGATFDSNAAVYSGGKINVLVLVSSEL